MTQTAAADPAVYRNYVRAFAPIAAALSKVQSKERARAEGNKKLSEMFAAEGMPYFDAGSFEYAKVLGVDYKRVEQMQMVLKHIEVVRETKMPVALPKGALTSKYTEWKGETVPGDIFYNAVVRSSVGLQVLTGTSMAEAYKNLADYITLIENEVQGIATDLLAYGQQLKRQMKGQLSGAGDGIEARLDISERLKTTEGFLAVVEMLYKNAVDVTPLAADVDTSLSRILRESAGINIASVYGINKHTGLSALGEWIKMFATDFKERTVESGAALSNATLLTTFTTFKKELEAKAKEYKDDHADVEELTRQIRAVQIAPTLAPLGTHFGWYSLLNVINAASKIQPTLTSVQSHLAEAVSSLGVANNTMSQLGKQMQQRANAREYVAKTLTQFAYKYHQALSPEKYLAAISDYDANNTLVIPQLVSSGVTGPTSLALPLKTGDGLDTTPDPTKSVLSIIRKPDGTILEKGVVDMVKMGDVVDEIITLIDGGKVTGVKALEYKADKENVREALHEILVLDPKRLRNTLKEADNHYVETYDHVITAASHLMMLVADMAVHRETINGYAEIYSIVADHHIEPKFVIDENTLDDLAKTLAADAERAERVVDTAYVNFVESMDSILSRRKRFREEARSDVVNVRQSLYSGIAELPPELGGGKAAGSGQTLKLKASSSE